MCGRYDLSTPPNRIQVRFRLDAPPPDFSNPDVRPTDLAPMIDATPTGRTTSLARWGLIPSWAKDQGIAQHTFNARGETVAEKPSFRAAFRKRRCVVPVTAFYEWQAVPGERRKRKLRFAGADQEPLALAGLWEHWIPPGSSEEVRSFTIITTNANAFMAPIHERMPVILSDADMDCWLDPDENNPLLLSSLLKPAGENMLALIEQEALGVQ